jgi:alcohol dehydrogenase class IV
MFLPGVIELNARKDASVYSGLLKEIDIPTTSELANRIRAAVKLSGVLPPSAALARMRSERKSIAQAAMHDRTIRTNPVRVSSQEIESLIDETVLSYE